MVTKNPLILIIDDEQAILKTLKDALGDESYRVETLNNGNKAIDLVGKLIPDLILLDIFMPNCNGLTLLKQIKREYPDQKVIIISGFGNIPIAIEAIKNGAIDFIEKPLNLDIILSKIEFLKTSYNNSKKPELHIKKTTKSIEKEYGIAGQSALFMELLSQAEKLASHFFPITIHGEHGTGKSTLARYIHKKSKLCKEDFRLIDCEKLANNFTDKFIGKSKETIFLKNVDKLNNNEQKNLLRNIEKINKTEENKRIIASSKRSLFDLTRSGYFNESLFYTLNIAPLEVPPLRKRPYDIPLLINYYLSKFNYKYNKNIIFAAQSIRLLRNNKWPGNISGLISTIQKIVICCDKSHDILTPQALTELVGEKNIEFIEEQSILSFNSLDEATREFKKNFLLYLLKKNHYNISAVSSILNLSSAQLKNKLVELQINI